MKSKFLLVDFIAMLCLAVYGITPLATINKMPITLYPFFDNFVSDYKIWEWMNISAFSFTHLLALLLLGYFSFKRNNLAKKITLFLITLNSALVVFVVWLSKNNSIPFPEIDFTFSYGWLFLIFGIFLFMYSIYRSSKNSG